MSDAVGAHGLEHIEGRDRVLLQILARVFEPEADVGIGGEMKDHVAARHSCPQFLEVQHVAFDQRERGVVLCAGKELHHTGREIVVADNPISGGQQPINQMAADKSGRAGDESCLVGKKRRRCHDQSTRLLAALDRDEVLFWAVLRPGRNTQNRLHR